MKVIFWMLSVSLLTLSRKLYRKYEGGKLRIKTTYFCLRVGMIKHCH